MYPSYAFAAYLSINQALSLSRDSPYGADIRCQQIRYILQVRTSLIWNQSAK